MRAVIQRVKRGEVHVDGTTVSSIGEGLVILLGVRKGDSEASARELAGRCSSLRIFGDDKGKMNRSLRDTGGSALVVSQFTLYADTRSGNRPGFSDAAPPEEAEKLYDSFVSALRSALGEERVATGVFRAMMDVVLVNSGPVTILLDDRVADSSQITTGGAARNA
jgi:D-tyrosyl-tRNA(Tyr) deacylase